MHIEPVNVKLHTFHSPRLRSVVKQAIEFLEKTPIHSLPPRGGFFGVGVYALYYRGEFEHYRRISTRNKESYVLPIYVGKAVPPGWRAARTSTAKLVHSLRGRLREHARSIEQSENIDVRDFLCCFMILEGIESDLISSVEAQMIRQHKPL